MLLRRNWSGILCACGLSCSPMELPATVPNPSLRPVDPDGRETLAFSVGVQRHDRFSGIALFKGPNYSPCKEFNLACCKRNAVRFAGGNGPCQMFGHGWYAVVRPRKPLGRTDRNNFREPILRVSSSGEQPAVLRRNHGDIQQGRHLVGHRWNDFRGRDVHGRERHRQLHGDCHEHGGHIQAISGDGGCYRGAATASSPTTASSAPHSGNRVFDLKGWHHVDFQPGGSRGPVCERRLLRRGPGDDHCD